MELGELAPGACLADLLPRLGRLSADLRLDAVEFTDAGKRQWLLPSVEFGGGCALIIGLLSVLAAFGLFVISAGAFTFDAVKRIRVWQPIDRADWLGDLLYVPEALYCIGLSVVMLAGPGPWSLDATIAALLAG